MTIQEYDSNFIRQVGAASKRQAEAPAVAPDTTDPTFDIRRKQANLCEAVMLRVIELETAGKAMLESAKKLRAAVLANT
jgi:hypothetical protein